MRLYEQNVIRTNSNMKKDICKNVESLYFFLYLL